MIAAFATFIDTGIGCAQAFFQALLIDHVFDLLVVDGNDQNVQIVQAIPMILNPTLAQVDHRSGIAVANQVGDSRRFVLSDVAQIRHVPGHIALLQNIFVHQNKLFNATHGQAKRDEAAAGTQADDAYLFLGEPIQVFRTD